MGKSSPARFQITLAQTAHVRFRTRKRVHTRLRQQDRTQRLTGRNTGRFGWGCYHYPRSVLRGSETLRGRVSERQTLPLLGLGRGKSRRTQKACGTAMRSCASLFRGVAAPLGCVIQLLFPSPHRRVSRFWLFMITARRERYSPVSHAGLLHSLCHSLPFRCSVHSIQLPLVELVDGKLNRQDRIEQTSVLLAPILRDDAGALRYY